jgi:hypothetical protein
MIIDTTASLFNIDNGQYDLEKLTSNINISKLRKTTPYARLCKSFSILTRQQKTQSHNRTKKFSSSEPIKLNSSNSSGTTGTGTTGGVKTHRNLNYLKNLNTFEQHIEIESLQLLVKKLENVTNLSALLKSIATSTSTFTNTNNASSIKNINGNEAAAAANNNNGKIKKSYNDAAVQTSMTFVTTSSMANASGENDLSSQHSGSFNSHGTTMQTNCYGSIVGNFGSIIIQQKYHQQQQQQHQQQHRPLRRDRESSTMLLASSSRLRTHNHQNILRSQSDDYGLSDELETSPMLFTTTSTSAKERLMRT